MPDPELAARVESMRRFSRFYTRKIGVLNERLLESPFSLPEGRVIFEIAQRPAASAAEIARALDLDASYLSRLLKRLESRGFVRRERSPSDGREYSLSLTAKGHQSFAVIDARSRDE
ncbi:MAG: MarR family transcriptional regulator, partial [Gammaproteobacteria bacterium]|nr:MarR family transcriptional regulator [Gammaproteobacteria bacterium]